MDSGTGLRNRRTGDSDELIDEDEQRAIVASYRKSNTRANTIWKWLSVLLASIIVLLKLYCIYSQFMTPFALPPHFLLSEIMSASSVLLLEIVSGVAVALSGIQAGTGDNRWGAASAAVAVCALVVAGAARAPLTSLAWFAGPPLLLAGLAVYAQSLIADVQEHIDQLAAHTYRYKTL